ncbi:MAG: tyrosine-type recombinase/integrase [Bacteroidales bacterium]|jgi:integrase/recombinase XerC|nr:tyrosine-type recombinase/integrase [Bacteroidales bacterium]
MEHVVPYLQYLEYEKRYSPHTIDAYRRDLSHFAAFLPEMGEESGMVDFKVIRRWIVALITEGKSPRTVNRKIATLRSFFKYLMKKGLATVNPMEKVGLLKIDRNLPVFVTADKMDELLDGEAVDPGDFKAMRDKLVPELFYMTGMRLSELIRLKESDVDTGAMTVKVLGKRNKERVIPLTAPFCDTLKQYISFKRSTFPGAGLLFILDSGKPLYERWVQRLTDKKLGAVTTMKKRSPHVLRHSFATNVLDNGAELNAIKEILGHSSLAATQVYTHSSLKRIKKVYNQAHPRA